MRKSMPGKTVIVIGVGRSGTKLVQLLLARILLDQNLTLRFYYEPLLWKSHKLTEISSNGIRVHQALPLFMDSQDVSVALPHLEFFDALIKPKGYATVVKFIRMTGRIALLNRFYPDAHIVYVFRDPVSVVQSILKYNFSLLGPPHYSSDLDRLLVEARAKGVYSSKLGREARSKRGAREALWWYANNLHLMRTLPAEKSVFTLSFDHLLQSPAREIRRICDYLQLPFKRDYTDFLQIPGANIRRLSNLFKPGLRYQAIEHKWEKIERGSLLDRLIGPQFVDTREDVNHDQLMETVRPEKHECKLSNEEQKNIENETFPVYEQLNELI